MATPAPQKNETPFSVPTGETNLDTETASGGNASITVSITVTGSVAQVQADYATLAAVSFSSPTATISWDAD